MSKLAIAALCFAGGIAVARAAAPPPQRLGSSAMSWEQIQNGPPKGKGRAIFQSPTATLDELEMHVTYLAPGQAPHPPHSHPQEEMVIIKEGTLEALQDGKTRRLGPGSVIFQASNQLHGVRNVGDVPASYYVVRWTSPGMPKASAPAPSK
jgi:XRE family transcriptional regulator, regulator of sulfur utilization